MRRGAIGADEARAIAFATALIAAPSDWPSLSLFSSSLSLLSLLLLFPSIFEGIERKSAFTTLLLLRIFFSLFRGIFFSSFFFFSLEGK